MDRRGAIVVAVAGLSLGVVLGVALAPDTGPDPLPPPEAPTPTAPARPSSAAPRAGFAGWLAPSASPAAYVPPTRDVVRYPPEIDPEQVHSPDSRGLASATMQRRDRLVACWEDYLDRVGGDAIGRFTVDVTVRPGEARPEVLVANAPDDLDLEACVDEALADARFEAPDDGVVTLRMPIPLPSTAE